MKRTRAEELVIVNWKGCFFQRYGLDSQVTALEGANGAGKTTVMIAAYVVLLPDMSRLRFTNLGETSPTGGDRGIFGRLGHASRPSYAAISFRLADGRRLIAGVHLERRTDPVVEPTTFVVTDLGDDVALEEVFLERGADDAVPTLEKLRELATLKGGRLKTFPTLKDYFGELFDQGVTPLRLATDEERTKLNEMLRTSMVGGISRALTGGLRDFLLKEETGLADALKRMRGNLDECRHTRLQVSEAARLEEEIHGVYQAGQRMFAAAVHATRQATDELEARVVDARERRDQAKRALELARAAIEAAQRELAAVRAQHEDVLRDLGVATDLRDRTKRANAIQRRVDQHERELAARHVERDDRLATRARAEDARAAARREREAAQEAERAAAQGLADFRKGFEELERRAAEHRFTLDRLKLARAGLDGEPADLDAIGDAQVDANERLSQLDRRIARLAGEIATAEARRQEHAEVIAALERVTPRSRWSSGDALAAARAALTELDRLEALATELAELPARLEAAQALMDRQSATRRDAQGLSTIVRPLKSASSVREAVDEVQAEVADRRALHAENSARLASAQRAALDARGREVALEERAGRWRELRTLVSPLVERWKLPVASRTDLNALHGAVRDRARALETERTRATVELEACRVETVRLEQGAALSDELLRARDQVGGELLAQRFEDTAIEEAPKVEALLGPLRDAIVVDDVPAAIAALRAGGSIPQTLWLWDAREPLVLDPGGRPPGDLQEQLAVVPFQGGQRLTRIPEHPTLGRRARERRLQDQRKRIEALGKQVASLRADERVCAADEATVLDVLPSIDVLEAGDPTDAVAAVKRELVEAQRALEKSKVEGATLGRQVDELAARQRALVTILPDAHLLDLPDQKQVVAAVQQRLTEARRATGELRRVADDRPLLASRLDVLRQPPPSEAALAALATELESLQASRRVLWEATNALAYVGEHRAALAWTDAEPALAASRGLVPALEAQLAGASAALAAADKRVDAADEGLQRAVAAEQKTQAEIDALDASLKRQRDDLAETQVADPSDEALVGAERRVADLGLRLSGLTRDIKGRESDVARREERIQIAAEALTTSEQVVVDEEAQWQPARDRWERLRTTAEGKGLLAGTMTRAFQEELGKLGSPNTWNKGQQEGRLLLERLEHAQRGPELALEIAGWLKKDDGRRGEDYLEAWLKVRSWLLLRIPPQIAEVAEPLEALARLKDHLLRLHDRLQNQERNLRGESENVARSIDTQIRKAHNTVNRLSQDLANVRFGSINGVRIKVEHESRMTQVLDALRDGGAQQVLFQSDMPIEAALEELFKRYGGSGRTGGHRLLDYREYLDLKVEIKRQSREDWEHANPSRLSTGEAIGVGAAVMMVVLTAWERDANLLRGKRSAGTLRLLFLDEATRLSQDNLIVLFELCKNLELQLLLAAPEIAHGGGNTTYHLVRKVINGEESVLVTGRRLAQSADP